MFHTPNQVHLLFLILSALVKRHEALSKRGPLLRNLRLGRIFPLWTQAQHRPQLGCRELQSRIHIAVEEVLAPCIVEVENVYSGIAGDE